MTASTGDSRPHRGGPGKPGGRGPKRFGGRHQGDRPHFGRPEGRSDNRGGGRFGPPADGERQRYHATCSECGSDCEVPFKPIHGKPVFCRDCFRREEGPEPRREREAPPSRPRQSDPYRAQFEQLNNKLDRILRALEAD